MKKYLLILFLVLVPFISKAATTLDTTIFPFNVSGYNISYTTDEGNDGESYFYPQNNTSTSYYKGQTFTDGSGNFLTIIDDGAILFSGGWYVVYGAAGSDACATATTFEDCVLSSVGYSSFTILNEVPKMNSSTLGTSIDSTNINAFEYTKTFFTKYWVMVLGFLILLYVIKKAEHTIIILFGGN